MAMPSFYKSPRRSIATTVESALGHKSVKQVYAERKAPGYGQLTGSERNIVVNDPRLKVQSRKGGWAKVTYTDPNAKSPITFNIRMKEIKDVMNKMPNAWFHPAEAVYSKWINKTTGGKVYSARRQVEGMRKAALKRLDMDEVARLDKILARSDKDVMQFRQEWEDAHTDAEIEDYYEYEETVVVW